MNVYHYRLTNDSHDSDMCCDLDLYKISDTLLKVVNPCKSQIVIISKFFCRKIDKCFKKSCWTVAGCKHVMWAIWSTKFTVAGLKSSWYACKITILAVADIGKVANMLQQYKPDCSRKAGMASGIHYLTVAVWKSSCYDGESNLYAARTT